MDHKKSQKIWYVENSVNSRIDFISSKDNDQERAELSKCDNIKTMFNDKADEAIKEFFDSLKNRYQNNLKSIEDKEFVFDYVYFLYYKCHKINPNCGGSYIDSPYWLKKAAINPINRKDNKCFQYAV